MMTLRKLMLLTAYLVALALVFSACSSDDPASPGDETAPMVVTVDPSNGDNRVGLSEEIVVNFNEAMDPATAASNVALTSGDVTGTTWSNDDQTLTIAHSAWAEAAQVTVTLNTGLTDAAGNGLAQASNTTFWTFSSTPALLLANPEHDDIDVLLNVQLQLFFSGEMNIASLQSAITLSDVEPGKVDFPFTVSHGDEDWVIVAPDGDLPESTVIHVTISTDAEYQNGTSLEEPIAFSFTTGTETDTTPPTITSFEPISGSTLATDTPYLRINFSEPINADTVNPTEMAAQLMLAILSDELSWNDDFTQVTVPLVTPLPTGVRMEAVFAGYEDLNGVEQTEESMWTATVAGTPDPYPVEDGLRFRFMEIWSEGPIGGEPDESGDYMVFIQLDTHPNNIFYRAEYDEGYTVTDDGEIHQETGSAILILGFYDEDPGAQHPIEFDTPLTWLPLPIPLDDEWGGHTSATFGEVTMTIDATGELVGGVQADLPWIFDKQPETSLYWTDTWHVRIVIDVNIQIELEEVDVMDSIEEYWYAPGYGIVQYTASETEYDEGRWSEIEGYVFVEDLK